MSPVRAAAVILLVAWAPACGSGRRPAAEHPRAEENRPAVGGAPRAGDRYGPRAVRSGPRFDECGLAPGGVVSRRALRSILGRGPGWLLQRLDLDRYPPQGQGPFQGWEVQEVRSRCLARVLEEGDVILDVDGFVPERPEDLWKLWRRLEAATEFRVRLKRAGRTRTIRFVVR